MRTWFEDFVLTTLRERILPVDTAVARRNAALDVPDPRPIRDTLLAATALVHAMGDRGTRTSENDASRAPRSAAASPTGAGHLRSGPEASRVGQINILTAFLAGLVSFVSPCVLPLVPSYLSFLTGTSLEDLKAETDAKARTRVFLHALAFVAGFTTIFVLIGLSASAIGAVFQNNKRAIELDRAA